MPMNELTLMVAKNKAANLVENISATLDGQDHAELVAMLATSVVIQNALLEIARREGTAAALRQWLSMMADISTSLLTVTRGVPPTVES